MKPFLHSQSSEMRVLDATTACKHKLINGVTLKQAQDNGAIAQSMLLQQQL